jgi:hypothetical protein
MSNLAYAYVDTRMNGFRGMELYFQYAKKIRMSPYYQDLYVDKVFPVDQMSLTELAYTMAINHREGVSALIYTHGEPKQVLFPIDPSQKKNYLDATDAARVSYHLDLLKANRLITQKDVILDPWIASKYPASIKAGNVGYYNETTPDYLKIHLAKGDKAAAREAADGLMVDLKQVRSYKIPHLAIRACRVGQNKDLMKYVGMMFGAQSVSAPKLKTASIVGPLKAIKMVEAEKQAAFAKAFQKVKHGQGGTHVYEYPNPFNKFGIGEPLRMTFQSVFAGRCRFYLQYVRASEDETISEFLWKTAGYTELMTPVRAAGYVALHALDGPNHRLIFPMEREYLTHMTFVDV